MSFYHTLTQYGVSGIQDTSGTVEVKMLQPGDAVNLATKVTALGRNLDHNLAIVEIM